MAHWHTDPPAPHLFFRFWKTAIFFCPPAYNCQILAPCSDMSLSNYKKKYDTLSSKFQNCVSYVISLGRVPKIWHLTTGGQFPIAVFTEFGALLRYRRVCPILNSLQQSIKLIDIKYPVFFKYNFGIVVYWKTTQKHQFLAHCDYTISFKVGFSYNFMPSNRPSTAKKFKILSYPSTIHILKIVYISIDYLILCSFIDWFKDFNLGQTLSHNFSFKFWEKRNFKLPSRN